MPHAKITQAYVDGLPFSDATIWHHDTELAGFNLAVGKRTRTFYAASETQGRFLRVKIGRSDLVRVNVARDLARNVLLPEIRAGVDPRTKQWSQDDDARTAMSQEARTALRAIRFQEKVERKARVSRDDPRPQPGQVETFAQTWHEYRHFGSKAKSSTLTEYERTLKVHVPDWFERATVEITPQDVLTTWRRLSRSSIVTAKALMRVVSAVMHDAQRREVITRVPTTSLPKGWSTVIRNPKRIKDVFHWWREVDRIDDLYPKSALKVLLLTGLRKGEVLSLRWQDVDLEGAKIHVRDPKRGLPRDVAISTWTVRQLKRLHEIKSGGFWVFPSHSSKGHLLSLPTLTYKAQKWRPKDTRNEWDSIATEIGIPHAQRAAQMGHAAGNMTDSYVVTPDVRNAVQAVADEIMQRVKGAAV